MKKPTRAPFRAADLHNLPLQEARQRFLDQFARHCPVLNVLLAQPLEIWLSLSDDAKEIGWRGWVEIEPSPYWSQIDPGVIAGDAAAQKDHKVHLELIPLREALHSWAAQFSLTNQAGPVFWAMESAVNTLHKAGRRPPEKRVVAWSHPPEMFEAYPALTEPGEWVRVGAGMPEEELFMIVIEIPPKQPNETLKAFEKRFNKKCREEREQYLHKLREADWATIQRPECLSWIDRFAQWQAGAPQSEIDPTMKTASQRSAFSRAIAHTADYIQITPRKSKHNPRHGKSRLPLHRD